MIWADVEHGLFLGSYTAESTKVGEQQDDAFLDYDEDYTEDIADKMDELFEPIWDQIRDADAFEIACREAGRTPRAEELIQQRMRRFKNSQRARKSCRTSVVIPRMRSSSGYSSAFDMTPMSRPSTDGDGSASVSPSSSWRARGSPSAWQSKRTREILETSMASTAPPFFSARARTKDMAKVFDASQEMSVTPSAGSMSARTYRNAATGWSTETESLLQNKSRPYSSCDQRPSKQACEPQMHMPPSRPHTSCGTGLPKVGISERLKPLLMPCMEYGVRGSPSPPGCKQFYRRRMSSEKRSESPIQQISSKGLGQQFSPKSLPSSKGLASKLADESKSEGASNQSPTRRAASKYKSNADDHKELETLNPNMKDKKMLEATIKRILSGEEVVDLTSIGDARVAVEKQATYQTDNIQPKELQSLEKAEIYNVFKSIVAGFVDEKTAVQWSKIAVPWSEVAKRLRGRLANAHIQRLGVYLNFTKRVRQMGYLDRVSIFISSSAEDKLKIFFAILDADGDGAIGARDIFSAMGSTKMGRKLGHSDHIDVCFNQQGAIGLGIQWANGIQRGLEVLNVDAASHAEQAGVQIGDLLMQVNGIDVEDLTPEKTRELLKSSTRPLRMQFLRGSRLGPDRAVLHHADFERLLCALQEKERMSVKITIVGAKGLRNADAGAGGKSDPYCSCEILGKPHTKFATKVVSDNLEPVWNEVRTIAEYEEHDVIRFVVYDRDIGQKQDESLGVASFKKSMVSPDGFEGEVELHDGRKSNNATLKLKVSVLPIGGIGFSEFKTIFAQGEPGFLAPIAELLTGNPLKPVDNTDNTRSGMKLLITLVEARGLRNADPGGKSDPYCICELSSKPHTRVQSRVIYDTLNPVWKERLTIAGFAEGDSLKISVFDKDTGPKAADPLGHVILSSKEFYKGFEGELKLVDAGKEKGFNPVLKVKIVVLGAPPETQLTPEEKLAINEANARGRSRYHDEVRDLRGRIWLSQIDLAWYMRTFTALCASDRWIHRDVFTQNASKVFGAPSALLAARWFDIMDEAGSNPDAVGIRTWATMVELISRGSYDQTMRLAFQLYDLDGDGTISIDDALNLIREEEFLLEHVQAFRPSSTPAPGKACEEEKEADPGSRLCEELKWVYTWVAAGSDDVGSGTNIDLDLWRFQQERPNPEIIRVLLENLMVLGDGDAVSDGE